MAAPPAITGENFADILRQFEETEPRADQRAWRDAMAAYLSGRGQARLADGDYEGALTEFRTALVHYPPSELAQGHLPSALGPLANAILTAASPRGDEARALASSRVLAMISPPDPQAIGRFNEIATWGESNRREFRQPWVFHGEMSDLYRDIVRILPDISFVRRSRDHAVERRQLALRELARVTPEPRSEMEVAMLRRSVERPVLDVTLLYLRLGDLDSAATETERMTGQNSRGISALLRSVLDDDTAETHFGLAQQLERVDPASMVGVCRRARRRFPSDVRFAQCLAAGSAAEGAMPLAAAHARAAAELQPEDPASLGRAIQLTIRWMTDEMVKRDIAAARGAVHSLRSLMRQWNEHFASQRAPLTENDIDASAAVVELSQGYLSTALPLLTRAAQGPTPSRRALLLLSEVAMRKQELGAALAHVTAAQAVAISSRESGSEVTLQMQLQRARVLHVAQSPEATAALEQAAAGLTALARSLDGVDRARAFLQLSIAQDALGQPEQAQASIDSATSAVPDDRAIGRAAMMQLLGRMQWSAAARVAASTRRIQSQDRQSARFLAISEYLAVRLAGDESDHARAVLRETVNNAGPMPSWTVLIAQRLLGAITHEQLWSNPHTPSQQAEALFYEGLLALAEGHQPEAESKLRECLATDAVLDAEFHSAWELLRRLRQR
jgi:tetratricopeptide (TPR) repeat protein